MAKKKDGKIAPIEIELKLKTKVEYVTARADYIRDMFGDATKAKEVWDARYPNGYEDWVYSNSPTLNTKGEQMLIDKLNEVIKAINSLPTA